ncbi:MAG TPA: class I SAM-dependent methyltransferase [Rhodobacteraceae bacterium]|nr:class I SAM-dependent methyltransferase [Paracoccaceae bacterium]
MLKHIVLSVNLFYMDKTGVEKKVASHYSRGNVSERILTALGLQDAADGSVTIDTLFPIDQLHHGGVGLTEKMAKVAGIKTGMKLLDAGSGIGGSSRYLAGTFDCIVQAIDISDEFVRTAEKLDQLVGLSDRIMHCTGSVTELPFDSSTFDVVWSQNVSMNVPDKRTMFAEAIRVLRPRGVYVVTHIGEGNGNAVDYPVPWAMTEDTSFALPPAELLQLLNGVGFQNITDHAKDTPITPPPPMADGQLDDSLAMGDDMPIRRANTGRAVADGRLIPMLVTAVRP